MSEHADQFNHAQIARRIRRGQGAGATVSLADREQRLRRLEALLSLRAVQRDDKQRRAATPNNKRQSGLSLIEMLVVIAVIVGLLGLSIPAWTHFIASSHEQRTAALIKLLDNAIANHQQQTILVPPAGTDPSKAAATFDAATQGQQRLLWDFNQDQILDGDTRHDNPDKRDSAFADDAAVFHEAKRSGYGGAYHTLGRTFDNKHIDDRGYFIDAWGNPIHILFDKQRFPDRGYGLWSLGPDGLSDSSDTMADDIRSWKEDT